MTSNRINVAVIYGSVRKGRFCDTVAEWVLARLKSRPEFSVDVIDPAAGPEARELDDDGGISADALKACIGQADAFIVVTPEYNHSYPAALKRVIDTVYGEWQAKPVAFVSYGGASGGIRAVEHLRGVFAELHAVGLRDSVVFPNVWDQFDARGAVRNPERAGGTMEVVLSRLAWWAEALREGRAARDYSEAVA